MKTPLVLAGLLATGLALAAKPSEFVSQWPVVAAGEGAYAVVLDEGMYRQTLSANLLDIVAFNATGEALPFGPMPASCTPPPSVWRDAVSFVLPALAGDRAAGDLHLHATRAADGALSLDARIGDAARSDPRQLLVDVRAKDHVIEALSFNFRDDTPDFSTDVRVEASDDLETWRTVVDRASIAQLRQGGQVLVRRLVEFSTSATPAMYLRVARIDGQALPPATVQLLLRPPGLRNSPPERQELTVASTGREGRAYLYELPGRFPVERVDIALASGNTIADFTVSVRDKGDRDWRYLGHLTAFGLRGAGVELDNEPMQVPLTRAREWRIEPSIELAAAPGLTFAYRPESWLLLTHGKGPYVVAAGSPRVRREDYPLEALVAQVRAKYGVGWQPALTPLGAMTAAGGPAALKAYSTEDKRTWLLWGVLVLGALVIVVMVLKLMRSPPV